MPLKKYVPSEVELAEWIRENSDGERAPTMFKYDTIHPPEWGGAVRIMAAYGVEYGSKSWRKWIHDLTDLVVANATGAGGYAGKVPNGPLTELERYNPSGDPTYDGWGVLTVRPHMRNVMEWCIRKHEYVPVGSEQVLEVI